MKKTKNFNYADMDFFLLILAVVCSVFGLVMISSAVRTMDGSGKYLIIQSVGIVLGIVLMFVLASIDYENLGNLTKFIYIGGILLLVTVLIIGTGKEEVGSKSWIRFGSIGFQPAEFVKIGFIITFSKHAADVSEEINKPKNVLLLCLHAGVILGLIALQPDFGTAMVMLVVFVCIVFSLRIHFVYILGGAAGAGISLPLVYRFLLNRDQKARIRVFLDPSLDPAGDGYNVLHAKELIGSGGLWGKGYFAPGTLTQRGYVPERHTDFIFSGIVE